ncbi:UDP-2,3-diacylglucosamine diphosphatase [Gimesia maris]|uniref:UDP-2,3-diacylglucosamine diphosphatase n=1 Tax=Gimesia maris TaxID=122 RepID=UPI0030D950AA
MIVSQNQSAATVSRSIRTIFVSDVHLGCMHSRAEEFLEFLNSHHPESLYLVGDLIDGWKLRKKWRWPHIYNEIFDRVEELSRKGTEVFYTPGNHDNFLRDFGKRFGFVSLSDEFVHLTADGRRFLIIHGDQFDKFETGAQWLSVLASFAYDMLLTVNTLFNRLMRRRGQTKFALSSAVKSQVKHLMRFISDYEKKLADHARLKRCEGIICGHIHAPNILDIDGINYCNTGDWVEHCSALIEYSDGELEIVFFDQEIEPVQKPVPQTRSERIRQEPFVDAEVPGLISRFWKKCHPLKLIRR